MKGNCESLMSRLNSAWYIVSTQKKKKNQKETVTFPLSTKAPRMEFICPGNLEAGCSINGMERVWLFVFLLAEEETVSFW